MDSVRLMAGPVSAINRVGLLQQCHMCEKTELKRMSHAVVKANFTVNFIVYSDISDAETLENRPSRFLQQSINAV